MLTYEEELERRRKEALKQQKPHTRATFEKALEECKDNNDLALLEDLVRNRANIRASLLLLHDLSRTALRSTR